MSPDHTIIAVILIMTIASILHGKWQYKRMQAAGDRIQALHKENMKALAEEKALHKEYKRLSEEYRSSK